MLVEYAQFCGHPLRLMVLWVFCLGLAWLLLSVAPMSAVHPCSTLEHVVAVLASLSQNAADRYTLSLLTLGMLFPFVYFSLFCGLVYRGGLAQSFPWLLELAMIVVTCNYLENALLFASHVMRKAAPDELLLAMLMIGEVKLVLAGAIVGIAIRLWLYINVKTAAV